MTNRVALIGAGAMGGSIGARLVETGNRLTVFDPGPDKVQALVDKGAFAAPSAAEAAAFSDYVILSLNAPAIVRQAVFGDAGVAAGAQAGTLIIDMSSIDPNATKQLAADAAEKGLR
ncbi:NAD(P)-binding domain-containing protein, partial [Sinorhizobium meliloti]